MTIRTEPHFELALHTPLCADEATVFTVESLVRLGRALTLLRGFSGSAPFGPKLSHDLRHGELSAFFPCQQNTCLTRQARGTDATDHTDHRLVPLAGAAVVVEQPGGHFLSHQLGGREF